MRKSILGFVLLVAVAPPVSASTVRWILARALPRGATLSCRYHDRLVDVHTRAELARHGGSLTGNMQSVADMIAGMRRVGYRVSGPRGNERLTKVLDYDGVFEQRVTFGARAFGDEVHVYAKFGRGHGRITADKRLKQYLNTANLKRIRSRYRKWKRAFRGEMRGLARYYGDYRFVLAPSERPELSRAMSGRVIKRLQMRYCGNHRFEQVRAYADWRRLETRERGEE